MPKVQSMHHRAVIFDMDGVLIDSEGFWTKAEQQVFGSLGVPLSNSLTQQTATMTTSEVTKFWYKLAPWEGRSLETVEMDVITSVEKQILAEGQAIKGIENILDLFSHKGFKIGLATNSPYRLIPSVLDKLKIRDYFQVLSSSEFEKKGKPDPSIYLHTATKLQVQAKECIVFEDSRSGLTAAKNAGMTTVFLDRDGVYNSGMSELVDLRISSFTEFTEEDLLLISGQS